MVFTGTYEHSIDAKNRLAVPAEVRAEIAREPGFDANGPVVLFVTLGEGDSLSLYTQREFEKRAEALEHSERDAEELLEYERLVFSLANRVELDGQGRVRLPDNLLEMTGLKGDVTLIGARDHLEIRDRAKWKAYLAESLAKRAKVLTMNPRQAMKKVAR